VLETVFFILVGLWSECARDHVKVLSHHFNALGSSWDFLSRMFMWGLPSRWRDAQ
jgi:hypothetical protein